MVLSAESLRAKSVLNTNSNKIRIFSIFNQITSYIKIFNFFFEKYYLCWFLMNWPRTFPAAQPALFCFSPLLILLVRKMNFHYAFDSGAGQTVTDVTQSSRLVMKITEKYRQLFNERGAGRLFKERVLFFPAPATKKPAFVEFTQRRQLFCLYRIHLSINCCFKTLKMKEV